MLATQGGSMEPYFVLFWVVTEQQPMATALQPASHRQLADAFGIIGHQQCTLVCPTIAVKTSGQWRDTISPQF